MILGQNSSAHVDRSGSRSDAVRLKWNELKLSREWLSKVDSWAGLYSRLRGVVLFGLLVSWNTMEDFFAYRIRLKRPPPRIDRLLKNEFGQWTSSVFQFILVWPCMALCGLVWPCLALFGLVWPCLASYGLVVAFHCHGRVCPHPT